MSTIMVIFVQSTFVLATFVHIRNVHFSTLGATRLVEKVSIDQLTLAGLWTVFGVVGPIFCLGNMFLLFIFYYNGVIQFVELSTLDLGWSMDINGKPCHAEIATYAIFFPWKYVFHYLSFIITGFYSF